MTPSIPASAANEPAWGQLLHAATDCPQCRRAAERCSALEAEARALRHDCERSAQRLQMVMDQLALAEERAGRRTLAGAIRSVAAGQSNLSFDAVWALFGEHEVAPAARDSAPHLGAREREVLRLITEGQRSPAIAARLGITLATVEVHRRNIMRKLGLHTVAGLTKYALREGLASL